MNLLELFAGSRSIGNEATKQGFNVFSVDWTNYEKIDLIIDIGKLKKEDVPFIPDVVWASPDCTTYSIAACSTHRTNTKQFGTVSITLKRIQKQEQNLQIFGLILKRGTLEKCVRITNMIKMVI